MTTQTKHEPEITEVLSSELQTFFLANVHEIEHFPIANILFKDIAPVLAQPGMLSRAVSAISPVVMELKPDKILAVDARGFILGAALADRTEAGLVMVRKPGKLPGTVHRFAYTCEYSSGHLEVTDGVIDYGDRCLIVDDLLATGGTARATSDFTVERGAIVVGYCFMVEIEALEGRKRLHDGPVHTIFRC
ncbi:adenine phosphoribosyltransferase [Gloeocapsopsis sp. IPPAS B-1203]|uniref:adenine phosphoribosyltransferase n=1 Tax=Gloeocapsopsis sp. IPPAS B-1203 TaxID=2049454 RepID=UPI000C18E962|nr:adenine phosphoribosyltransferase [Gloeocapsopsis sp. IPPAS B-1203]PIG92850.1 adenine phosphoribosyltransferase [Gloeocapsopsis sp. IPPAS B-1203]